MFPGHISLEANGFIGHGSVENPCPILVDTLGKFSTEELNSSDGEYRPEKETDHQHVKDGRDGMHQRIHYNLKMIHSRGLDSKCTKTLTYFEGHIKHKSHILCK